MNLTLRNGLEILKKNPKSPRNNSTKPFQFFCKCVKSTSSAFRGLVIQKNALEELP